MKKTIFSIFFIIIFVMYVLYQNFGGSSSKVLTNNTDLSSTSTSITNQNSQTVSSTNNVKYKDGVYKGSVADAYYGNLQVQTTISGGKITDVVFLQYSNDREESRQVNGRAMPLLKKEAITIQNANVDTVSGATYSSQAFRESLNYALSQATV